MNSTAAVSSGYSADTANPHYLKRVVEMSASTTVQTNEDIFDQHGIKILARGAVVDATVYERLLRYKLRKPIEAVLGVEDGMTATELTALAEDLLEANVSLGRTLASINADAAVMRLVKQLKLEGSSQVMLSLQRQESTRLRHGMLVALLAAGIGYHARLPEAEMSALIAAGVLHDIGELYIDPAILQSGRPLSPAEWRHIASHPLAGGMVIRETMHFPRETARFVAEHHERVNGYGYPRLLSGNDISAGGLCLGTAEVVAGIIGREGDDLCRIGSALKLIPGEFPRVCVSLVEQTYRAMRDELALPPELLRGEGLQSRVDTLAAVLDDSMRWLGGRPEPTSAGSPIFRFVRERLLHLQRAACSVGIVGGGAIDDASLSPQEKIEIHSVCQEIRFRIRELTYLTVLHDKADEQVQDFLTELAERLFSTGTPTPRPIAAAA